MEIQKTRIFRIPGQRIVKDYVCEHLGLTDADYDKIEPKVFWDIKESGDHDKGDYKQELKELKITIEE